MSDIGQRQKEILREVVAEYIKKARPVSSDFLKEKYRLVVSSATIRLDFAELTGAGFLEKGYVSGGRTPTDKGYRFFVNELLGEIADEQSISDFWSFCGEAKDELKLGRQIAKTLACFSCNLSISYFPDIDILWKEGWEGLTRMPEFKDIAHLEKFYQLVEDLEKSIAKLDSLVEDKRIKVYIGKECPLRRKEFSMVLGKSAGPKKATFVIAGPKRMDFKKNIGLIDSLIGSLENY